MVCSCDFIVVKRRGSLDVAENDLFRNINDNNASMPTLEPFAERLQITPCGTLSFCDLTSNEDCYETPVKSCTQCSIAKGAVLIFFIILLALAILIGNVLVIFFGRLRYKRRTITKVDNAKTSLAMADMLSGKLFYWQLVFVFMKIMNSLVTISPKIFKLTGKKRKWYIYLHIFHSFIHFSFFIFGTTAIANAQ